MPAELIQSKPEMWRADLEDNTVGRLKAAHDLRMHKTCPSFRVLGASSIVNKHLTALMSRRPADLLMQLAPQAEGCLWSLAQPLVVQKDGHRYLLCNQLVCNMDMDTP